MVGAEEQRQWVGPDPAIREAVASGATVVSCDMPALDGSGHARRWFVLIGWAHAPAGIREVWISVDGLRAERVEYGRQRPDIAAHLEIPPQLGFISCLDAAEWGPGSHLVSVTAVSEDGRRAAISGAITISEHGGYRALRELPRSIAGPLRARRRGRRGGGRLLRVEGHDLRGELSRLAGRRRAHLLLVDEGCTLAPGARARIGDAFGAADAPDLAYADEDAIVSDGGRGADFLKPGWSPELLLSTDYIGPLVAVGAKAARAVLEAGTEPITSIYSLLLRLVDADLKIERIPAVLSTSASPRTGADGEQVRREIETLGRRRGLRPRITPAGPPGMRHVGWELRGRPKVSIVIPTTFRDGLAERCLSSIAARSSYTNLEVVIVDSGDEPRGRDSLVEGIDVRIVPYEGEFNFSRACNLGAAHASGDYILLLNDDTEVASPDWIERMLEHAQLDGVGAVGAKLIYPDGSIQHAGVTIASNADGGAHMFAALPADADGYRGLLHATRNVSAVTGACMMVPRALWESLDGMDEHLAIEYGDIDICLRAIDAGRRVVWTPRAVLVHHEQSTRGPGDFRDALRFKERWIGKYGSGDPLYHPAFFEYPSYEYLMPVEGNFAIGAPDQDQDPDRQRESEERFVPEGFGRSRLIEAEHEARYRWAAQAAEGRQVLDAGCGVGYGSAVLAEAGATRVVGIDVSEEAIASAKNRAGDQVEFALADLHQLPFEDATFDLITCFEAIEHVVDADSALDELRRVLRPDGLLLISSPNRGVYPPGNPHHAHEFTPAELADALGRRFDSVRLYREQSNLAASISPDSDYTVGRPDTALGAEVRRVVPGTPGIELYTLAAASNADLPQLGGEVVLTHSFELTALLEHAKAKEREALAVKADLEHVLGSASFRITAPLRAAKRLFKHRGRP